MKLKKIISGKSAISPSLFIKPKTSVAFNHVCLISGYLKQDFRVCLASNNR